MGLSGKTRQVDGGVAESEGKRWAIAGIPLKPIYTTHPAAAAGSVGSNNNNDNTEVKDGDDNESEDLSTTPRSEEARIPSKLTCPAAPRKRKSPSKCSYGGGIRGFFDTPPDLESVFIRHLKRAAAN